VAVVKWNKLEFQQEGDQALYKDCPVFCTRGTKTFVERGGATGPSYITGTYRKGSDNQGLHTQKGEQKRRTHKETALSSVSTILSFMLHES